MVYDKDNVKLKWVLEQFSKALMIIMYERTIGVLESLFKCIRPYN